MCVTLHIQMMPIAQINGRLTLKCAAGDKRSAIVRQFTKLAHLDNIKESKGESR